MRTIDDLCRTPPGKAAVSLRGESGMLYGFTAFPLAEAPCGPAVYIYARPAENRPSPAQPYWTLLGIGESPGLCERRERRFARMVKGQTLGATHLLIHFCGRGVDLRRMIAGDLSQGQQLPVERPDYGPRAA